MMGRALGALFALVAIGAAATAAAMPQTPRAPAARAIEAQQHLVEGRVVSRTGEAVAGATIIARAAILSSALGPRTSYETVSDAEGRFFLDDLPPGTYWFVALHADVAGSSPAVPVVGPTEVTLRLTDEPTRA